MLQLAALSSLGCLINTLFGPRPVWLVVADGRAVVLLRIGLVAAVVLHAAVDVIVIFVIREAASRRATGAA